MARFTFTATAPDTWSVLMDGVATGIVISTSGSPASRDALVELGRKIKLAEGAEAYLPHFRAYSEASNARAETPKEALPPEVTDKLEEAAAFLREIKAVRPEVGPR